MISACVLDFNGARGVVDEVRGLVEAEACYSNQNRLIMQTIYALHDEGRPYEPTAVFERLRADGRAKEAGGSAYLVQMVQATPAIVNPKEHARTVADLHRVRSAIHAALRIAGEGYGTLGDVDGSSDRERVQAWLTQAEQTFADITHEREQAKLRQLSDVMNDVMVSVSEASRNNSTVTGVPSGFIELDKLTTGSHAGDVTIIASRPGMGKTAWALSKVLMESRKGYAKPVFSLEMPALQLGLRLLSMDSGVPLSRLRQGSCSPNQWNDITNAMKRLSALPVFIDDTPAVTVFDIKARVRLLQRECAANKHPSVTRGVGPVTIDYLQLMGSPLKQRFSNREQEVGANSRELKRAAKELSLPFDVLSQLNRETDKRTDKRPHLSDLRESGSVEQDADNVIFIYRDEYYNKDTVDAGIAEAIVAKQRNGPTATIRVKFTKETTCFQNLSDGFEDFDDDGIVDGLVDP